jgi:hypothetical protein
VYGVAASVAAGIPMKRILASYPNLKREHVELAALDAVPNPQRSRPRQRPLPFGAFIISKRPTPLTQSA